MAGTFSIGSDFLASIASIKQKADSLSESYGSESAFTYALGRNRTSILRTGILRVIHYTTRAFGR